jgi:non-canonical poly(A) RNA polymerase PAPD5/7
LKNSRGSYKIQVFGSVAAGYDLSFADLDLRLYKPGMERLVKAPSPQTTYDLERYLESIIPMLHSLGFEKPLFVHSRYPLVDSTYKASGTKVQVVSANSSLLSKRFIKKQVQEHPDLLSIYAVIRTMINIRNLNDVFRGGIGSYSLLMMIIASLKLLPGSSPGENLINFLEFYSTIDTTKHTIGIVPPGIHPRYSKRMDIPLPPNSPTREQVVSLYSAASTSSQQGTPFSPLHKPPP